MRKRTKAKSKSIKSDAATKKRELKKIQRYTQLSLKGDVLGYFGSPLFHDDVANLGAKDRIRIFIDLLQYVFPKLQATAVDFSSNDPSTREGANRILELSKRFKEVGMGDGPITQVQTVGYAELIE